MYLNRLVLSGCWRLFCDINCIRSQIFATFCSPGVCFDPSPPAQGIAASYFSTRLLTGPGLWVLGFPCAFLSCLDILIPIWTPLSRFWKIFLSSGSAWWWPLFSILAVTVCLLSLDCSYVWLSPASDPSLPGLLCLMSVHSSTATLALHKV